MGLNLRWKAAKRDPCQMNQQASLLSLPAVVGERFRSHLFPRAFVLQEPPLLVLNF